MNVRGNWWKSIGMAFCLNAAVALADDEAPVKPGTVDVDFQSVVFGLADGDSTSQPALARIAVAADSQQGKYWIGLMCTAPGDALRAQLDLAADVGLLVEEVSEGSPAMKAGMQRHDLVLSATIPSKGEPDVRRLADVTDLIKAVQAAEKSSLKLEFLRRGRKQSLDLLPEERPQTQFNFNVVIGSDLGVALGNAHGLESVQGNVSGIWAGPVLMNYLVQSPLPKGMTIEFQPAEGQPEKVTVKRGDQTWEAEIKALDKLPEEIGALVRQQLTPWWHTRLTASQSRAAAYSAIVANPVRVVYGDVKIASALPEDVTVTVIRKGAEPAKITIKKGDQTWEATEQEVDKLPPEARHFAETMLRGPISGGRRPVTQHIPIPTQTAPAGKPESVQLVVRQLGASQSIKPTISNSRPVQKQADLERQLKELSDRVEQLRQAVEKSQPKQ